jgi:hypothetical protein
VLVTERGIYSLDSITKGAWDFSIHTGLIIANEDLGGILNRTTLGLVDKE